MSLDSRLAVAHFYVVGPDITEIGKSFIILRVVGRIKKPDEIGSRIGLEDYSLIITDLPSSSFYKGWAYAGEIILPKNIGGNNRTAVYVINLYLKDFKEISYDGFRKEHTMKIYKSKSIAYADRRLRINEDDPYIVVMINQYVKKKLPEDVIRNIYRDLHI